MYRSYFSWEEQEANKQGHEDERRNRSDFEHNRYAYDGVDRAYWDGRKDEQEAERQREEERMREEEQQREEDERRDMRRREMQEEEERQHQYQRDYEREMEDRRAQEEYVRQEAQEFPDEQPSSEEELFRKILEDERGI
jgi:hypothetical protein